MDYTELTSILDTCISKIRDSCKNYHEVVAVSRGGLTAAHYVAKELRLDVGVILTKRKEIYLNNETSKNLLIVEDLVAEGRTYDLIKDIMSKYDYSWDFLPVLVDSSYPDNFQLQGIKTKEWIVFPYEKIEKMKEGDRGLFREKTDEYGVNL